MTQQPYAHYANMSIKTNMPDILPKTVHIPQQKIII